MMQKSKKTRMRPTLVFAAFSVAGIASCARGSGEPFDASYEARAAHIAALQSMSDAERFNYLQNRFKERLAAQPANAVEGVVRDMTGAPIEGVRVHAGEASTVTAFDGSYSIELPLGRHVLTFEHPRHALIQRVADIEPGLPSQLDSTMMPLGGAHRLNADALSNVKEGPITLEFEPGDLAYEDGTIVHGDVAVRVTVFDPRQNGDMEAAPVAFEGIDADGNEVLLRSFGMVDVELSANGKKVNVANGQTVATSLDLGSRYALDPGKGIPMWHHDVDKGMWVEERPAMATVEKTENGAFVATAKLPHFSAWNYDVAARAICASIVVPIKASTNPQTVSLRVISADANGNPDGPNGAGYWSMTTPCTPINNTAKVVCAFNVPVSDGWHSEVTFALQVSTSNTGGFTPIQVTMPGSPTIYPPPLRMTTMANWLTSNPTITPGSWCGATKFSSTEVSGNINLMPTTLSQLQAVPNRINFGYPTATQPPMRIYIGPESSADTGFLAIATNERTAATAANPDLDARVDMGSPRDLCVKNSNASQVDSDGNGVGDVCEAYCDVPPSDEAFLEDYDLDGVHDMCDNKWSIWNPAQYQ